MEFLFLLWWNVYEFKENPELLEQSLILHAQQNDLVILAEYRPDKISSYAFNKIKDRLPHYNFIPYGDKKLGMAFFSKEKLSDLSIHKFSNSNRFLAEVSYDNNKIFATHLEQRWLLDRKYESNTLQKAYVLKEILWGTNNSVYQQARQMWEILEKSSDHVLVGDFNVFPSFFGIQSNFYKKMEEKYNYKALVKEKTWGSETIEDIKDLPYLTLDQVFVKGKSKVKKYKVSFSDTSDHRPVQAVLEKRK